MEEKTIYTILGITSFLSGVCLIISTIIGAIKHHRKERRDNFLSSNFEI